MINHNNRTQVKQRKVSQLITETKELQKQHEQYEVERYVYSIVDYVINISAEVAYRNHEVMSLLEVYAQGKTLDNINQINDILFYEAGSPGRGHSQQNQPQPLRIDSLLPISADIDSKEKPIYKNLSFGGLSEIRSRPTGTARQTPNPKQIYLKLDLPVPQEQEGYIKQLRRIQEQRFTKVQNEKRQEQKKQKIKQQKLKDKKNQKEQKFSYGYNGEVIEIRLQNKNNLVSKVINGFTDSKAKLIKEVCNDPNPTHLEGYKPGKKDSKVINLGMTMKPRNEVEFSEIKSLAQNIKTTNGIKYTYQGKTYQEKRKVVTATQLKKTLSQRRLTKQQFGKIKNPIGVRDQYVQMKKSTVRQNNQNEATMQRARSQSKVSQYGNIKMKEIIRVNSKNLRQKLLERDLNPPPTKLDNQQQEEVPLSEQKRLGFMDSFNLQYIRTGGSLQTKTSQQFFSNKLNQLPKISNMTVYSKGFPKGRQRIKDSNEIIRDLRKKFQEKLRV